MTQIQKDVKKLVRNEQLLADVLGIDLYRKIQLRQEGDSLEAMLEKLDNSVLMQFA